MAGPITDPGLLAQLNGAPAQSGPQPVSDPALLAQLNGERKVVERGSILPFTKYSDGTWDNFDWKNSGILGSVFGAVTAPGDVYNGKMAPGGEQAIGRAADLAGIISPVNPAVRAGDFALAPGVLKDSQQSKVAVPTSEQLRAAGSSGFGKARGMGVDFSGKAVRDLATGVRSQLEQDGILGELAPKTFSVLKKLESAPEGSVAPLQGIEAARRAFGNAAKDFSNPTEQLAARRIVEAIDKFVANPDPASVVAGPAAEAGKLMSESRANWAASKRADSLTGIADRADLRAAAANSGRNLDNTIRQRVADVLINPKLSAGFTEAERAALEEVVRGTPTRNAARTLGNVLGGGGGLGTVVTGSAGGMGVGMATGGPVGAAIGATVPPLVGVASKTAANRMTSSALSAAEKQTRMRSPLFQALMQKAGLEAAPVGGKEALLKALLASQLGSGD